MPKDLVDSFRAGDELTADLVDAILRELRRLRKMSAVPPMGLANAEGMAPPVFYMVESDNLVPFQNDSSPVLAGSLGTPSTFTATLLMTATGGAFTASGAPTTTMGRHFMAIDIPASANGWAVWRDGYLWPITWDGC